jgi:hypothetical protein
MLRIAGIPAANIHGYQTTLSGDYGIMGKSDLTMRHEFGQTPTIPKIRDWFYANQCNSPSQAEKTLYGSGIDVTFKSVAPIPVFSSL